jgi:spermidine/putrescine transport system substrate-binding protein
MMMKTRLSTALGLACALTLAGTLSASAEGALNIYNWGDYTNPELIKKFEAKYNVKVTITDYDSNDTAIAKVKAGAHGFDIVVPSGNFMQFWIEQGLLLETRPDQMENFKNMDPRWVDVPWDPGRKYSVPWQWGLTGTAVNTATYKGDINDWKVIFDPPPELAGKINVVPEMNDVINSALWYVGGEHCSADKDKLKAARDVLMAAKPKWIAMDYGTWEKLSKGDFQAAFLWNGAAMRARLANKDVKFGFPKQGFVAWMDNVAVLKDAKNPENAKLFQNFIMDPENAALISAYARYGAGIKGAEAFYPEDMKGAPELTIPEGSKAVFVMACPPEVQEIFTKIWTEVTK